MATPDSNTPPPNASEAFGQLEYRLACLTAQLACANHALDASDAVDSCEAATRAQIVVRKTVADLEQLHNDLNIFSIDHLRVAS